MNLTIDIRNTTIEKILVEKFTPKVDPLIKSIKGIANTAAKNFYPESVRNWMAAKPEEAPSFHMKSTFSLYGEYLDDKTVRQNTIFHNLFFGVDALDRDIGFRGKTVSLTNSYPFMDIYDNALILKIDSSALKKAEEIIKQFESIEDEIRELRKTLTSAFYACNTKKQLEQHYPDLVKYLPPPKIKKGHQITITNNDVKKALAA